MHCPEQDIDQCWPSTQRRLVLIWRCIPPPMAENPNFRLPRQTSPYWPYLISMDTEGAGDSPELIIDSLIPSVRIIQSRLPNEVILPISKCHLDWLTISSSQVGSGGAPCTMPSMGVT